MRWRWEVVSLATDCYWMWTGVLNERIVRIGRSGWNRGMIASE